MHTWDRGDEDGKLRATRALPMLPCPSVTIIYIMTFSQTLTIPDVSHLIFIISPQNTVAMEGIFCFYTKKLKISFPEK